jgi:hypothetical protein
MKIRNASQFAITTQASAVTDKTLTAQVPSLVKNGLPAAFGQSIPVGKNGLPGGIGRNGLPGLPGNNIPGFDKNGLPGRFGREGFPGLPGGNIPGLPGGMGRGGFPGLPGNSIPGFEKNGMPGGRDRGIPGLGFGESGGFPGMPGVPGGIGGHRGGPALKMPGSDRMGGDVSGAIFGGGTWDFNSSGFHASPSGGVTFGGYGVGVNERGQVGVAKGDAGGGSVTSPADAKGAANKAVGGGGSQNKTAGAPEGLDWSKGTHVKDSSTMPVSTEPKKQEGPNDLGPSTNDPATEPKKENETAVAQNDTTKNTQAGKPNPYAMPNPEDSGGGTPRSSTSHFGALFMPNPEDSGGGTPRSHVSSVSRFSALFMPNPEDSGGGTPRSVIANVAAKLR